LGGDNFDQGRGIAVGSDGAAYVTGRETSSNFPSVNPLPPSGDGDDAFVAKLDPTGSHLVYSSRFGGGGSDEGAAIAVGGDGSAYVVGSSSVIRFPTVNPFQGPGGGSDGFVARISPSGSSFVYSSLLGGEGFDLPLAVAVDTAGSVYVTGFTNSTQFPVVHATQGVNAGFGEAFITQIIGDPPSIAFSTYLGGVWGEEQGRTIAVAGNSIYVAGSTTAVFGTTSPSFPTVNPLQPAYGGGECSQFGFVFPCPDAFVAKLALGPTPPDTSIAEGPADGSFTRSHDATFTFTGTDEGMPSDELTFECSLDHAAFTPCVSPQLYVGLADGSHAFAVRAVNAVGNKDPTPAARTWTVDTTPPTLVVVPSPAVLWPPNQQLVPVMIAISASDDSGPTTVVLLSVTSSEPDNGPGDGNSTGDIQGADIGMFDDALLLRAERAGGGPDRVYVATYQATDRAGNTATTTASIRVPQSSGP